MADGNGVAMVWSQVVDAVCSGGNAWMQLRLGGSFVVCPKTFFLSERRFAQAPRAWYFLMTESPPRQRIFHRETNISDKRVIWLLRLDRARGAETGLLEKRQLCGA